MTKSMNRAVRTLYGVAAGAALAIAASGVGAAVLYQQLPNQTNAWDANPSIEQQVADNFTLSGTVKITSITWWGANKFDSSSPDNFLVRLYKSISEPDPGLPISGGIGTPTLVGTFFGLNEYQYDFALDAPLDLSAGTYYLSVYNQNADSEWVWLSGGLGDGVFHVRASNDDAWVRAIDNLGADVSDDLAFRLNGIPEPGSMALLLLAGTALLLTRRHINQGQQQ